MRVILKPTRFSFDDIELRMFAPGGASLASDAEYPSAYLSDGVVANTGIGALSGRELARRIAPTSVELTPTMRDDIVYFSGSAAPRDINLLFQLVNLYFTAPRADTTAFRRYKQRAAEYAHGRVADPDAIFADSVAATVTQHDVRALTQTAHFTDAVRLATALDFWKARMANASGFTVVLTGDFALVRMRQLASQYLASLPAGAPEHQRYRGYQFPHGVSRRRIVAGVGPRARTEITISGAYDGSSEAADGIEEAEELAERALNDDLRERLGGTYDASVTSSYSSAPPRHYVITIDFAAQPERIDSLADAALRELERLRVEGPTELEAAKVIAARTHDLDGESESNSYWATALAWHAQMGWPLAEIGTRDVRAKFVTRKSLAAACATYLNASQYVEVTMIPSPEKHPNGVRSPSASAARRPNPP